MLSRLNPVVDGSLVLLEGEGLATLEPGVSRVSELAVGPLVRLDILEEDGGLAWLLAISLFCSSGLYFIGTRAITTA